MTAAVLILLTAISAEPSQSRACVPGRQLSCACASGDTGAQRCRSDGGGFESCQGCENSRINRSDPDSPIDWTRVASLSDVRSPERSLGLHASVGAAIDKPAAAGAVGFRVRLNDRWLTGVTGEWNPWASFDTTRVTAGSLNVYGSLARRWRINEWFHMRTTAHVGMSWLLFDLVGSPAGTYGGYLRMSWLGLEVKLSERIWLLVEPLDVAVPAPSLSGVPITYQQYRFTTGLYFGL